MNDQESSVVELGAKVARYSDRKAVAVRWPRPVDRRLDQLVTRLSDAGERTDRTELLAAIVTVTEPDDDALREALQRYRTATNREVLLDAPDALVTRLPVHGPGPRTSEADT